MSTFNKIRKEVMKMGKDEIIQYIEEHFDEVYKDCMKDCDGDEDIFVFQYMIKKFKKEMEQEKEKNKELEKENWIMRTVDKQYISKDKIREFIKENLPDDEICSCCDNYDSNGVAIKINLENLLKE